MEFDFLFLSLLFFMFCVFFFFKQKTAYEMRISDWSSDVCSSDLDRAFPTILRTKLANSASRCSIFGKEADRSTTNRVALTANEASAQHLFLRCGGPCAVGIWQGEILG